MRRRSVLATLLVTVVVGLAVPAAAEPGDLDGAYGLCGFADSSYREANPAAIGVESSRGLVRQTTGAIVHVFVGRDGVLALARFGAGGALDPTYGNEGILVTDLRAPSTLDAVRYAYPGANDRLYLIGSTPFGTVIEARTRNGALDTSFDGDGRRVYPSEQLSSATVQPDGRLLVALWDTGVTLRRLQLDGSDDPTFQLTGDPYGPVNAPIFAASDPSGRILIVRGDINHDASVSRYQPDGTIDPTFTFDETVPAGGRTEYRVEDLDPQPDGTAYLTERRAYQDSAIGGLRTLIDAYVVRLGNDGAPDPTFGTGGWIELPADQFAIPSELEVLPNHDIVATGLEQTLAQTLPRVFVRRRTSTGTTPSGWTDRDILVTDESSANPAQHGLVVAGEVAYVAASAAGRVGFTSVAAVRLDALRQGAGLMLQWNGDAWPTRFGSDPGPECPYNTPYWSDGDLARGIATVDGKGGYVADAYGGIHRFSVGLHHPRPPRAVGGPYWPGWDIARGIASKPDGTGGYLLDAYGGVHPFRTGANPMPARIVNGPYWPGWNITRGIALMPDGARGYILDGFGGIHPFTTPGHAMPPALNQTAYWLGWDIARGIAVLPDGTGGYIVDAYGGAHPFGIGTHAPPPTLGNGSPYAPGEDWVRGFTFIAPAPAAPGAVASTRVRGATTDSADAPPATRQRRDPTPRGPASP